MVIPSGTIKSFRPRPSDPEWWALIGHSCFVDEMLVPPLFLPVDLKNNKEDEDNYENHYPVAHQLVT